MNRRSTVPAAKIGRTALPSRNWGIALFGLFLGLFGMIALSGPGRIDIVDGQTRYEAAKSLVAHGDLAIRKDRVWFFVYPGRDGQRHTDYRLPQIVFGALAVFLADATGPESLGRRHLFFALTNAVAAAGLAVLYAVWFRHRSPTTAVLLGGLGVLSMPALVRCERVLPGVVAHCGVASGGAAGYRGRQSISRLRLTTALVDRVSAARFRGEARADSPDADDIFRNDRRRFCHARHVRSLARKQALQSRMNEKRTTVGRSYRSLRADFNSRHSERRSSGSHEIPRRRAT